MGPDRAAVQATDSNWLGGGWLAVARFVIAAPLLAVLARGRLRAALTPGIVPPAPPATAASPRSRTWGIAQTSVSHAALIVGAVPVLVAIIVGVLGRSAAGPLAWAGSPLALAGVGLVAGSGGAGTASLGRPARAAVRHRLGRVHRPPARAARRPRSGCRHRGPARRRRRRLAAVRDHLRGRAACSGGGRSRRRGARARPDGHGARLLAVRVGAVACARGARECVREPRAAGRHAHRRRRVQRRVRPGAARRRHGDPRRHRARRDAAAQAPTSRSVGRRGRSRRSDRRPGAWPPRPCRPPHRAPAGLRYRPCPSPPNPDRPHSRVPHHRPARPRA